MVVLQPAGACCYAVCALLHLHCWIRCCFLAHMVDYFFYPYLFPHYKTMQKRWRWSLLIWTKWLGTFFRMNWCVLAWLKKELIFTTWIKANLCFNNTIKKKKKINHTNILFIFNPKYKQSSKNRYFMQRFSQDWPWKRARKSEKWRWSSELSKWCFCCAG